jgi:hypothetical protein
MLVNVLDHLEKAGRHVEHIAAIRTVWPSLATRACHLPFRRPPEMNPERMIDENDCIDAA